MIFSKQIFILVFCVLGNLQGAVLESEVDTDLISSILKYLNERNPSYFYKTGRILQKTVKGDRLEATFDVETVCEYPCLGGILKCQSIFQKLIGESFWRLDGAICAPEEPVYLEQTKNIATPNEKSAAELKKYVEEPKVVHDFVEEPKRVQTDADPQLKHFEINENNGEKSVPCLGCPMDVNPNAEGVNNLINTALKHIESERSQKHIALKVLRVQQQVVAGIKYILLVEVAPTVCPKNFDASLDQCPIDGAKGSFVCEIEFWEKSWERFSTVLKNNCTIAQEFAYNNLISTTPKTPDREVDLSDLESQIFSDYEIQQYQPDSYQPDWANGINPIFSDVRYGPEVILHKRKVRDVQEQNENEHTVSKRHSRDSESESSSSSNESNESKVRKKHNDNSDDDSSKSSHSHKHKHVKSDCDCDSHEHSHKHKHSSRESDESDHREPVKDKNRSNDSDDSSKSRKSSESSDSSQSDDHKKKHRHHDVRRKRYVDSEDDSEIVNDLSWIASRILGYNNYQTVGSSKVVLDGLHYKLQLLLEKNRAVIECSVFVTVNEENIYESSIDKYRCNTDEVWRRGKREDRNIVGGIKPIPKDDPQIKLYLKDGLTNMDQSSSHAHKYKIVEILEASSQVVSGSLHRIKARITVSDCEKSSNVDSDSCGVLKDAPVKVCNFKIWDQPWLPQGRKTDINCENDEEYHFRQRRSPQTIAGGIIPIPKDDPQVKLYLRDGLTNMDQSSPHAHKYKIVEILEASSQVVSGSLHRIKARITVSDCEKGSKVDSDTCGVLKDAPVKVCNFKIWDQPWLPQGRKTDINCEKDEEYHFRQRRSSQTVPGGINSIPKDDPQVKLYLKDGLTNMDESSPHAHKYKILEILEASSQVVSGSLHRIKARVTVSDCEKSSKVDSDSCGVLKDAPVKLCNFKIWDQPWLPQGRKTDINCEKDEEYHFRQRRHINVEDAVAVYFKHFQFKYSKTYANKAEYKHRLKVFKNNLNMIDLLNKYEQGTATYAVNQYADLTPAEFSQLHGLRTDLRSENEIAFGEAKIPDIDLPTSMDWRDKNAVTEVKDQGMCGSCWAFSTTGNIEGQYAIKYKNLKSFSEQELVDCDKLDDGCNGGLMDNAYRAIEKLGGLELEKEYPYDARDEKCHFNKSEVIVQVSSALNISHNETDMAKWLTQNGPISIAINANAMQFYSGGVSHPFKIFCNPKSLDHGVLIVGYGVHTSTIRKKNLPYWIVKNSWGKDWGEKGYYRVYRGDGTCGLNQTPSSAVVA